MEKNYLKNILIFAVLALFSGIFFCFTQGYAFASESKNYKISEDSVGFGKTQGGQDQLVTNSNFEVKNNAKTFSGLASLGTISLRPVGFQVIFAIFVFLLVILVVFKDFFRKILVILRIIGKNGK